MSLREQKKKMREQDTIQIPEGYKQTKVGLIPEDWYVKPVSELFEYLRTKSYSRENLTFDEKESNVFYIHYGDIHSKYRYGILDFEKEELIPRLKKEFITNDLTFLNEGDLILADASEDYEGIGAAIELKNIGTEKVIAGLHTFALRDYAGFTSKGYRGYLLENRNVVKSIWKIATGISVLGISKGNFSKITLPIPPLHEQKNIADCLSIWDKAIEKQQALIEQKEFQKKGLMQQLLSGKKRLKGFRDKWEEMKLGEIADRVVRKNIEGDNNIVTISAQKGFIKQGEFFSKRIASETVYDYTLVHKGEFCYNKSYSNGYPMGVFKRLDNFEKGVVTTLYICFRINQFAHSEFMVNYFDFGMLNQGLMKVAKEGGRAHGLLNISLSDFFNLKLTLPPLKEQTAIAEILIAADKEIDLEKQQLQELKDQKKGLMQQLLTGKKRLRFSLEPVH